LAEALWQSLERESDVFPLNDGQRQLLDRRLDAFLANSDDVLSWEEVKASLRQRQIELEVGGSLRRRRYIQ
jgi:putative addiction module component (TIGR02574 family)